MTPNRFIKFLLVDDKEANLLALEGLLKRPGLELLKARSGAEALELLLAHEVALALVDVQMPEMDGFELARLMRGTDRTRHIPIIFVTAGTVDQQRRFDGYDAGAVDFLFKPIEAHILQSKANIFFNVAQQREELRENEKRFREANAKLTQTVTELQNARRAALNGMEEAVQSRAAAEKLNIALRESEERLRLLVEGSPNAMVMTDEAGLMTLVNSQAERVFGYTRDELLGQPVEMLVPERYRATHPTLRAGFLQAPMARPMGAGRDLFGLRKEGTEVPVEIGLSPLRMGERTFVLVTVTDITERKQAEGALREAGERKNEFLAMLAHELRNPLAPIRHALQVMRLTGGDREAAPGAFEMIERQVGQMARLVDDLLDVNRISRGKIELRTGRIELASTIHHAVETVRELVQSMNQDLTVTVPPEPVYLNADPTRLAQVVGNLLNNACKFTEQCGHIWLTVERVGEQAVIKVRDTGIGIAADQLPRIFDLFTQIDTSLERTHGGLGIGLSLVKNLVEMHGGTVEVHSAGVGQGSEFVVRLPLWKNENGVSTAESSDSDPQSSAFLPRSSKRILVVDDNKDSAASLAMVLKLAGNETRAAYDGLEAVDMAGTFRPDVVLLDIGLPRLNGYEVCRRIREQPWGKNIVLVALTGWGQEEDRQKSREAGFNGHLVKPVEYAALMKLLTDSIISG